MGSTAATEFVAPALEKLLPNLSQEQQLRLQNQIRERDRIWKRHNKHSPPPPTEFSERQRDLFIVPQVLDALGHYNARHPGSEFDVVKPLMRSYVRFWGQTWFHVNFWARNRSNNKIKRFFAEVHYKPPPLSSFAHSSASRPASIPIVEICTIIEEPLSQYKRSCAFCPGHLDILHPKGCRKFVCENDKDRIEQRLEHRHAGVELGGMPFTCRLGPLPLPVQDEEKRRLNN